MKSKVSLFDLKSALWDERFQNLFPEFKEQIIEFMKDPGCMCNVGFLRTLLKYKDRLKQYFPTKEVVTPEDEEEELKNIKNSWKVINCGIHNLAQKLKEMPKGKRMMTASRFRDEVTVVLNDVMYLSVQLKENELNWKVINTTIFELEKELVNIGVGRKMLQITRYEEQVTAILTND